MKLPIQEYNVVRSKGLLILTEEVNELMKEGWIIGGNLIVTPQGQYIQPLVKMLTVNEMIADMVD